MLVCQGLLTCFSQFQTAALFIVVVVSVRQASEHADQMPALPSWQSGASGSTMLPVQSYTAADDAFVAVQAENDPIAPYEAVPQQAIADNPNCILASTPTGGHLAWISGPTGPFGE